MKKTERGKRHNVLAAILAAVFSAGIFLNCLTSFAYAYFGDATSGRAGTIKGANYDIQVEYITSAVDRPQGSEAVEAPEETPVSEEAPGNGEAQAGGEAPAGEALQSQEEPVSDQPSDIAPQAEEPAPAVAAVDGTNPFHVNVTGEHQFKLTATGNASSGYCVITVGDTTYTTEPIAPGAAPLFTVSASEGDTIIFQPTWGSPVPESVNLYGTNLTVGDGSLAQDDEAPSETTEPAGATVPDNTQSSGITEEEDPWEAMPELYQNDYPENLYGNGTVATSGCGITALAMVGSYMTGYEYRPDQLAYYFGSKAFSNIARLEYGSDKLHLAWEKAENFDVTYRALQEGKIAIALMGEKSLFTQSQHFIVLAGLTEDGRILVKDPNRDNYDNPQLKKAFQDGFKKGDIQLGYSGAWIYDKSAMPEEVPLYYEPPYQRGEPRYPEITLTQEEVELLAKLVWVEARGECLEGQQAVAEVVLNRLHSDGFPSTLHDVIYGEGQFPSVDKLEEAEPWQAQWEAVEKAMYGPYVLPEGVTYFATTQPNANLWGSIGNHVFCFAPTPQTEATEPPPPTEETEPPIQTEETVPAEDSTGTQ